MEHPENNEEYKGLTVNQGVEQPSIVNPYINLRSRPKRRQFSVGEYVEGIVKGDITMLSRAVTLVESIKPEHQAIAQEVIEKCTRTSGHSSGSDRKMSALFRQFCKSWNKWCPGCGKEYLY